MRVSNPGQAMVAQGFALGLHRPACFGAPGDAWHNMAQCGACKGSSFMMPLMVDSNDPQGAAEKGGSS